MTELARPEPCPACEAPSTFFPSEGRWYHVDRGDNTSCWAKLGIGADVPAARSDESFPVPDTGAEERGTGLYLDVAALLDGGLPEPPAPVLLHRDDGHALFYAGQVNYIFGDPESGKSLLAQAAVAEALRRGRKVLFLDLDHNGPQATVCRLLDMGVDESPLRDLGTFRYVEPEDKAHLMAVAADSRTWRPAVAIVDSIGELLPLMNLSSNSPDDFTIAHTAVLKPLAVAGAAVLAIDHLPKGAESRASGPTGTAAKRRAIGGVSIRVTINEQFTPGRGGSAWLSVNKDRHGGLRRHCPAEGKEPSAGLFRIASSDDVISWSIRAPQLGDTAEISGVSKDDLAALDEMTPPPTSVKDVKDRLRWGSTRAADALRVWRSRSRTDPEERGTDGDNVRSLFPDPGPRNEERDLCASCNQPLDPGLAAAGETIHPSCQESP